MSFISSTFDFSCSISSSCADDGLKACVSSSVNRTPCMQPSAVRALIGISNLLVAVLMARRPERDECSSRATAVLGRSKRLLIKTLSEAFEDNSDLEVKGRLDNSTEEDFEEKLRTSESEESLPYPAFADDFMLHHERKLSRLLVEKYSKTICCLERRCSHCFAR